jgi:hypothetical protein
MSIHKELSCRRGRDLSLLALLGVLAFPLAGCDVESILEVEDPDIVTPESLVRSGPAGINALYAGAIGDFAVAYDGGGGGGSFIDGIVTTSAYLSDEAYLAGTFPTRTEFDQRSVDVRNGTLEGVFSRLQRARRATDNAATLIGGTASGADDPRVGELRALNGFSYIAFGENFCSGVPFSTAPEQGDLEFGGPQTREQIFALAVQQFQAAAGQAASKAEIANLVRVGHARALLNQGEFAAAAQAVSAVPTDFVYELTHSTTSGRQENGLNAASDRTLRLSIANDEGGNGPPFLGGDDSGEGIDFLDAEDPRLPYVFVKNAFDTSVPAISPAGGTYIPTAYGGFGIPLTRTAPSPFATGVEARLIEAETALRGGSAPLALIILNQLRADSGLGLSPLMDAGSPEARVDQLFRERAFWLYGTGHRVGDLRRLIREYGRSREQVFPTGSYFKGGTFGQDVNLPVPLDEQNNPNFDQCLDREA